MEARLINFTVPELKEMCRTYGLPVSGIKDDIIKRIVKHQQTKLKEKSRKTNVTIRSKSMKIFKTIKHRLTSSPSESAESESAPIHVTDTSTQTEGMSLQMMDASSQTENTSLSTQAECKRSSTPQSLPPENAIGRKTCYQKMLKYARIIFVWIFYLLLLLASFDGGRSVYRYCFEDDDGPFETIVLNPKHRYKFE